KRMPPDSSPIGGISTSFTSEVTIRPKAPPIMIPMARSMTLPRIANSRNHFHMAISLHPALADIVPQAEGVFIPSFDLSSAARLDQPDQRHVALFPCFAGRCVTQLRVQTDVSFASRSRPQDEGFVPEFGFDGPHQERPDASPLKFRRYDKLLDRYDVSL